MIYSILRLFYYLLTIYTAYFVISSRRNCSGREEAENDARAQANSTTQSFQRAIHVEAVEGTDNCYSAFAEPRWCGRPHFELGIAQRLDHHLSNSNTL